MLLISLMQLTEKRFVDVRRPLMKELAGMIKSRGPAEGPDDVARIINDIAHHSDPRSPDSLRLRTIFMSLFGASHDILKPHIMHVAEELWDEFKHLFMPEPLPESKQPRKRTKKARRAAR